jgi:hypothetical protein
MPFPATATIASQKLFQHRKVLVFGRLCVDYEKFTASQRELI